MTIRLPAGSASGADREAQVRLEELDDQMAVHRAIRMPCELFAGLLLIAALALTVASGAWAAPPAAIDEYIAAPPPVGHSGPGQGHAGSQGQSPVGPVVTPSGTGTPSATVHSSSQGTGRGNDGGGTGALPFTGYPDSDLVLWVLLLVGGGIALRVASAGYQRLRGPRGTA